MTVELKCDRKVFADAVEWVTRSLWGHALTAGSTIAFGESGGRVVVAAQCGEETVRTPLAGQFTGDSPLSMCAPELAWRLGQMDEVVGDVVLTQLPTGVLLGVGTETRALERRVALPTANGRVSSLVKVEASPLQEAVASVRTLSGGGRVHFEVGRRRVLVMGADEEQAAVVPIEVLDVAGELGRAKRFSVDGVRVETVLRRLRGTVALDGVRLRETSSGRFHQLRLSDDRSRATFASGTRKFPRYRRLLQSGPGAAFEVDPAVLRRVVSHAGALARTWGERSPVVELCASDGRVVVHPVFMFGQGRLEAVSVDAVVHGDVPRAQYRADGLATALDSFHAHSVTIFTRGENADATIVDGFGRWDDERCARRSVAGIELRPGTW